MPRKRSRNAKPLRAVRGGSQLRKAKAPRPKNIGNASGLIMYKSPRTIMPTQYNTRLVYLIDTVVTNVGNTQASIRYRNEAFDVDPSLGSTAMPGFTEFAGFYQRFRTLGIGYKFSYANQEAFSNTLIHGFSTSSIASGSLNLQYAGNPLFTTTMVGPLTGMNVGMVSNHKSIVDIFGTQQPLYDDLFTGSTTSATLSTTATCYCYLGVIGPVVLTAAGVLVTVEIHLDLQFFRPTFLLT
jgi:hypothetical protein